MPPQYYRGLTILARRIGRLAGAVLLAEGEVQPAVR